TQEPLVYRRQLLHNCLDVEPLNERICVSSGDLCAEFFSSDSEESKESLYRIHRYYKRDWLQSCLQSKLNHWLSQCRNELDLVKTPASLSCVDLAAYQSIYYRMKAVYGPKLVANWSERTNAEKFVYEDIGIAAYLMCIWQGQTGVRFVDIGCGNGLLVYLLNSEGHNGIGYDIRKRKIWETYPDTVRRALIEQTIIPTAEGLAFPEADWLLGNHSDELTPWLPVLGSRSGCCGVFLLPCCPFNFDGSRYDRRGGVAGGGGSCSRYRDYLSYIGDLCHRVGYNSVSRDCLRIPSTKRVCFVATQLDAERSKLVISELALPESTSSFRPRSVDAEITPRNCARVPVDTRQRVELALFRALLEDGDNDFDADCHQGDKDFDADCHQGDKDFKTEDIQSDSDNKDLKGPIRNDTAMAKIAKLKSQQIIQLAEQQKAKTKTWNTGRSLPLSQLISLLSESDRAALKNECGGLQTLLRNCHQAFRVQSGVVRLRRRGGRYREKQRLRRKTKPCWMDQHHPDGCCLPAADCAFKHACETTSTDVDSVEMATVQSSTSSLLTDISV
uniref:tRNA (uracil-O(2)-)-methyltransferase n=1 Tax=Macrostomum lignano TaxID=282301 RepID=A0A1I8I2X9_9PLAT